AALPDTKDSIARVDAACTLHHPVVPDTHMVPAQEPGQRPARPIPYDIRVTGTPTDGAQFRLTIENAGQAGAALTIYADDPNSGPWYYTVEAGGRLDDLLPLTGTHFGFSAYGPNGFLRRFSGAIEGNRLEATARFDAAAGALVLAIKNRG